MIVLSQDPASSWLSYAKAVDPNNADTTIITKMEAYWKICDIPAEISCYFTPWFGIETSDNLNLLQPVNPFNRQWTIYNEYFQWKPEHNYNSRSHDVKPNDIIYGSVTYDGDTKNSYTLHIGDLNDKWNVNSTIDIQKDANGKYKRYTIGYVVFEHPCSTCKHYPPDISIIFYDINIEYNNTKVEPKWTTAVKTDVCNNRANVLNESAIEITWQS